MGLLSKRKKSADDLETEGDISDTEDRTVVADEFDPEELVKNKPSKKGILKSLSGFLSMPQLQPKRREAIFVPGYDEGDAIPFTPHSVAAGTVPLVRGAHPEPLAYNAAAHAVGTEALCLVMQVYNGKVWWIAAPSVDIPNGRVRTPLAQALPRHPAHDGEKGYLCETDGGMATIIRRDNDFIIHVGDEHSAQQLCDRLDVEVVRTSQRTPDETEEEAEIWTNWHLAEQQRADRAVSQVINWGLVLIGVCAVVWLVLAGLTTNQKAAHEDYVAAWRTHANGLASELRGLQINPAMDQMNRLNETLMFVQETEGVIQKYEVDQSGGAIVIHVPLWTLPTRIAEFGKGGELEVEKTDDYRIVTKRWGAK